jgi:hypothetical protein
MAIGSDRLHRNVITLDDDEKKTRKMDAAQFQQLLGTERVTKPVEAVGTPAPQNRATTADLMATVDDAFAEFSEPEPAAVQQPAPVQPPAPVQQPAPVHRLETRHAAGLAPLAKPAQVAERPPMPVAPSRMMVPLFAIAGVLIAAILVGLVLLVIK